ncbi:ATP synthase F0 subunit C [candidate division KSB1 bacterium]|nr:MAG: ATP synthase F0 subunit C [candidate division KSB1 bacterium]
MTAAYIAAGFGAAITTIGAAYGISKIATASVEGIARQPEAGGAIRVSMIISAALIEGIALFSTAICFFLSSK